MKAKKAIKRLDHVESLLSGVIDQYSGADAALLELLQSAKETVFRAKSKVTEQEKPKAHKKASGAKKKRVRRASAPRDSKSKSA